MYILYLLISAFLSPAFTAERINCTRISKTYRSKQYDEVYLNGSLDVEIDRYDKLSVYTYNHTKYSNFLVKDAQINFNGVAFQRQRSIDHGNRITLSLHYLSDIEGVAKLENESNGIKLLTECEINLGNKTNSRYASPLDVDSIIFEEAHACVQAELCSTFGKIEFDDFLRANKSDYDFGSMSAVYKALGEKYPNLHFPSSKRKLDLQDTFNLMTDLWLVSLIDRVSDNAEGKIDLHRISKKFDGWLTRGYLKMDDGYLRNMRNVSRVGDVSIVNQGLDFKISADYELVEAELHFDKFKFKRELVTADGQCDIFIDKIYFRLEARANYNRMFCNVDLSYMRYNETGVHLNLVNATFHDKVAASLLAESLILQPTKKLINYIKNKFRYKIKIGGFDC